MANITANNTIGRLSSLVLFVAVLAVLTGFAITPFIQLPRQDEQIENNRELLGALRLQLARLSDLARNDGARHSLPNPARLFLSGNTTGIAGAELQKMIGDLVGAHGGAASSFQTLPPQPDGDLTRLSLSLSMRIDIDGLRKFLHQIETGSPLIFIDDIEIQAPNSGDAGKDPYFLGPLDITMQLSGFLPRSGTL